MIRKTGNNLDYKSVIQESHQISSSLKDTDGGLTHIPKLFLQEADRHQMKTADLKHVDLRPFETRRLTDDA